MSDLTKKGLPLILVSGSAEDDRTYSPPMPNPSAVRDLAALLGAALAKGECRIAVFSADSSYIEAQVVRGFVDALRSKTKKDRARRIEIRKGLGGNASFAERQEYDDMFVERTDQHRSWRRSFMRTLSESDAVLLVGGERMTSVVGHAAAGFGIPVLALAGLGGASEEVWQALQSGSKGGPTPDEYEAMVVRGRSQDTAERCVVGLRAQIARREEEQNAAGDAVRILNLRLGVRAFAGALVLVTVIVLTWAASLYPTTTWANLALYLMGPFGGCAAALVATSLREELPHGMLRAGAQGFFAGFLASSLYLIAQMSSKNYEPNALAFLFACVTGIAAGFTAERVLRDWISGKNQLRQLSHRD